MDPPPNQERVNFEVSSDFQIWQIYLGKTADGPPKNNRTRVNF